MITRAWWCCAASADKYSSCVSFVYRSMRALLPRDNVGPPRLADNAIRRSLLHQERKWSLCETTEGREIYDDEHASDSCLSSAAVHRSTDKLSGEIYFEMTRPAKHNLPLRNIYEFTTISTACFTIFPPQIYLAGPPIYAVEARNDDNFMVFCLELFQTMSVTVHL